MPHLPRLSWLIVFFAAAACGDSSESDDIGVAAECSVTEDCNQDTDPPLECLTGFRGGYCGIGDCTSNDDCPEDSICVTHDDGNNYCFRSCTDKSECNANRTADNEANCSSNITRTDEGTTKACVPPSS